MKKIALFCVSYYSDRELAAYRLSIDRAKTKAGTLVSLDVFVARNTEEHNPGYFGAISQMMQQVDVGTYDYTIISNVDLTVEKDFFLKLAAYPCEPDTGWVAPQIYSQLEGRDRNPKILRRNSKRKLQILKTLYRFPILDTLYTRTAYRRKRYERHAAGPIYAGHGSFIILTRRYFEQCGSISYPIFLFGEEIYLAERCREEGLKVMYVPRLKVNDTEHASTGQMRHSTYCHYNYQAVAYLIRRFYSDC